MKEQLESHPEYDLKEMEQAVGFDYSAKPDPAKVEESVLHYLRSVEKERRGNMRKVADSSIYFSPVVISDVGPEIAVRGLRNNGGNEIWGLVRQENFDDFDPDIDYNEDWRPLEVSELLKVLEDNKDLAEKVGAPAVLDYGIDIGGVSVANQDDFVLSSSKDRLFSDIIWDKIQENASDDLANWSHVGIWEAAVRMIKFRSNDGVLLAGEHFDPFIGKHVLPRSVEAGTFGYPVYIKNVFVFKDHNQVSDSEEIGATFEEWRDVFGTEKELSKGFIENGDLVEFLRSRHDCLFLYYLPKEFRERFVLEEALRYVTEDKPLDSFLSDYLSNEERVFASQLKTLDLFSSPFALAKIPGMTEGVLSAIEDYHSYYGRVWGGVDLYRDLDFLGGKRFVGSWIKPYALSHSQIQQQNRYVFNRVFVPKSSENPVTDLKQFVFLLGGHDLEMEEIKKVLVERGFDVYDRNLSWGAKVSDYKDIIENNPDKEIFGIELEDDGLVKLSDKYHVIDHHGNLKDKPSSLEQVLDLVHVRPSLYEVAVAANDKGYIPAMEEIGLNRQVINQIRYMDRKAQGITPAEEKAQIEALKNGLSRVGELAVVNTSCSRFAPITDALYPQKRILCVAPDEYCFYGEGCDLVKRVADRLGVGFAYNGASFAGGGGEYVGELISMACCKFEQDGSFGKELSDIDIDNVVGFCKKELVFENSKELPDGDIVRIWNDAFGASEVDAVSVLSSLVAVDPSCGNDLFASFVNVMQQRNALQQKL